MSYLYTYILAPDKGANFQILSGMAQLFPDLVEELRIKTVFKRNANDIVSNDGSLLAPASTLSYFYVKVTTAEFDPSMISGVLEAETFNRDNQPFSEYWI